MGKFAKIAAGGYVKRQEMGSFLALLFLILVFSFFSKNFLSLETWGALITSSTEIGILALGITLLMICGEIDLSVGSIFAISGVLFANANLMWGLHPISAAILSLSLGSFIGFVNGFITVTTKLPSFIVTLGSMLFWQGCVLVMTNGFPISDIDQKAGFKWLSYEIVFGFRWSFVLWIFLALFFMFLLKKHPLGNWILASGGNEQAAFAMGVRTSWVKIFCFALTGFLSALAALVQFSHLESISPLAGDQYQLKAIAIAVVGGTALTGGSGTILGTVIGTLIMGVLTTGLVQAGISNYWFRTFVGLIIVVAVLMNGRLQKILRIPS